MRRLLEPQDYASFGEVEGPWGGSSDDRRRAGLPGPASPDDQGDIAALLVDTESPHLLEDRGHDMAGALVASTPHHVEQPLLAELLVTLVERFCDAVGVDGKQIARAQLKLRGATSSKRAKAPPHAVA